MLCNIVEYGSGTVLKTQKETKRAAEANGSPSRKIIWIPDDKKTRASTLKKEEGIEYLKPEWLYDCVSSYSLLPYDDYFFDCIPIK